MSASPITKRNVEAVAARLLASSCLTFCTSSNPDGQARRYELTFGNGRHVHAYGSRAAFDMLTAAEAGWQSAQQTT